MFLLSETRACESWIWFLLFISTVNGGNKQWLDARIYKSVEVLWSIINPFPLTWSTPQKPHIFGAGTTHIWEQWECSPDLWALFHEPRSRGPRGPAPGVPQEPSGSLLPPTIKSWARMDIWHCEWSSFTNRPTGPKGPKATLWNTEFDKQFSKVSPWPITWTKTAAGILFASLVRECHTSVTVCSFFCAWV